jgi:hypothetical protein
MFRNLKLGYGSNAQQLKLRAEYRFEEFERDPAKYSQSRVLRASERGKCPDISVSARQYQRPTPFRTGKYVWKPRRAETPVGAFGSKVWTPSPGTERPKRARSLIQARRERGKL